MSRLNLPIRCFHPAPLFEHLCDVAASIGRFPLLATVYYVTATGGPTAVFVDKDMQVTSD